ncbi:hypothetical protein [Actinocorallia aurantiaca]|uniref:PH (Pleckstrin Homology) domain-containing protein n=1 Tax=Actinocorallia aurantiaca TaxID=46204 RepID=A0ABN3U0Y6_9ACTN
MQQIEFRLEERQRRLYLILAGVWGLLGLLRLFTSVGSAVVAFVVAGVMVLYYFRFAGFGLTLTPQGLTMNGWQTHTHPWSQIRSVEKQKWWFQDRVLIRFADGTSRRAWAPLHYFSMPDPEFALKLQGLQQWHAQYSGMPPVQPPQQPFGAPQQPFGGPQQAFGAPAPQQAFGGPQQPPAPQYGHQPQPYGQQPPYQQQPQPGYGQPPAPAQPQYGGPQGGQQPPQQTPGEWTQVFGAGNGNPPA